MALSKGTVDLCVKSCHALLLALSYSCTVYISDYKCGKKVKGRICSYINLTDIVHRSTFSVA